jgi:GDSL-like Lipase/Acylhydrolase family
MKYNVLDGEIQAGVLYKVAGEQSVEYDSVTYITDQTFRGVDGVVNFTYLGFGTQILNEILEFRGGSIEFLLNPEEQVTDDGPTVLKGMAIEFDLNEAEKIVQEVTEIKGMALELIDYPFYSFMITEQRFSMRPKEVEPMLFLDDFKSDMKMAFSLSKLFSDSTNCIRVRKGDDNSEQDFGFITDGSLDIVGIESFLNGEDGYVAVVYDQTGNDKHCYQATLSLQPKISFNALNGKSGIYFDGIDDKMVIPSMFDSSFDKSFTQFSLYKKASNSFTLHESAVGVNGTYFLAVNSFGAQIALPAFSESVSGEMLYNDVLLPQLQAVSYDGHFVSRWVNNALYKRVVAEETGDILGLRGGMNIGHLDDGYYWDGDIFTKIYMNAVPSDEQIKQIGDKLKADFGMGIKPFVRFSGNSLTAGVGSGSDQDDYPGNSYPSQLVELAGGLSIMDFKNQGQGGATTEDIISIFSVSDVWKTNGFADKNIILFWEGRNSMTLGDSAQEAFDAMMTYLSLQRRLGYKICVLTCQASIFTTDWDEPNGWGVTTNQFEARRQTYNQMIRDGLGTNPNYDYVVDIGANEHLGDINTCGNQDYWEAPNGTVHFNASGYLLTAQLCLPTFNDMLSL